MMRHERSNERTARTHKDIDLPKHLNISRILTGSAGGGALEVGCRGGGVTRGGAERGAADGARGSKEGTGSETQHLGIPPDSRGARKSHFCVSRSGCRVL